MYNNDLTAYNVSFLVFFLAHVKFSPFSQAINKLQIWFLLLRVKAHLYDKSIRKCLVSFMVLYQ